MTVFEAGRASASRHVLAEGPVWVASNSRILWVDIDRGSVFIGRLVGGTIEQSHHFDLGGTVGAAVAGDDDSILVAAADRLVVFRADGSRFEGPVIVGAGVNGRLNDGACDPAGRFVVGTLSLDGRKGKERLVRLEFDGTVTVLDSDLTLSNGIAWSPDGTLMYSTDTASGIIWVRDYDVSTGVVGGRRAHLRFHDGSPDGICVDSRGSLWVALWGAGEVHSFLPSGEPADVVTVPVPHVSSVAFVGDHLDRLLVTTSSRDLSEHDLLLYPDAGRLFLVDVGVAGLATPAWASAALRSSTD